jgi:hypothetical protein
MSLLRRLCHSRENGNLYYCNKKTAADIDETVLLIYLDSRLRGNDAKFGMGITRVIRHLLNVLRGNDERGGFPHSSQISFSTKTFCSRGNDIGGAGMTERAE